MGSRILRGEEGNEIVEFAFASFMFFMVLFGFIWLGFIFYMKNTTAEVAREATRWASVRGTDCTNPPITDGTCPATKTNLQTFAQSSLPGAANMTVTPTWYDSTGTNKGTTNQGAGGSIQVLVTYKIPVTSYLPFLDSSGNPFTVSSTSQSVIW
jgi:Flp pilus assembly protein TadG